MAFLESVRAAVLRSASRRDPWPPLEKVVDIGALRLELRRIIDGLPPSSERAETAALWAADTLERFLDWLVPQLLALDVGQTTQELQEILGAALPSFITGDAVVGLRPSTTAEVGAIRRTFELLRTSSGSLINDPWRASVVYAAQLGLLSGGVLMPAGQILLSLSEPGARRWLLTLEVHQALGADDPWRVTRSHLEYLLDHPKVEDFPFEPDLWAESRLGALGLVHFWEENGVHGYNLSEANAAELRAVLASDSPMWALAKGIIPDPSTALRVGARHAGRAAAELGRAAAHELLNVLPLIDGSIERLDTALGGTSIEIVAAPELQKLRGHIERLFRYADWFKQLGESLDRPPERFGARAMLEDALQLANGGVIERNLDILPELSLYALRDRLNLALVNLLRNARQHATTRVRLSARTEQQQLYLEVDDDGPGVPSDRVPMVFVSPFTTREDGSGQGLPLAKRIIEDEHRGSIGYSPSPLGGARFTIRLPI